MYEAISRTPDGRILDAPRTRYWSEVFAWMAMPPYAEAGGMVAGETQVIWSIELYITSFDYRGEELTWPRRARSKRSERRSVHRLLDRGPFDEDKRDPHMEPRRLIPEALADHEVFFDMYNFRADFLLVGLHAAGWRHRGRVGFLG